jgi:hypothetical protein
MITAPTAVAICPPWCVSEPSTHDIAWVESAGFVTHSSEPLGLIEIDAMQTVLPDGTFGRIEEPYIYYDVIDEHCSPEDAREFAAELLRAAERLEEIRRASA